MDSIPHKKARVFFSEDQKDTLRMTYAEDPYPNQATIECLAQQLTVTPKTIVNWFHNHRMRAKQQQHNGTTPIKVEADDMSNHSDSMSSETSSNIRSLQSSDGVAQWMFPTPEPVSDSRRSSFNSTDSQEKATDLSAKSSSYQKDIKGEEPGKENSAPPKVISSGGNRRKSAKPKWAYEGTQLDKCRQTIDIESGELQPCDLSVNKSRDTEPRHLEHVPSPSADTHNSGNKENKQVSSSSKSLPDSIEKMKNAIQPPHLRWEDEADRKDKIEKLQKNLSVAKDDEDWQF